MIEKIIQALLGFAISYLERKATEAKAATAESYKKLLAAYKEVVIVEKKIADINIGRMSDEEFDAWWASHHPVDSERMLSIRTTDDSSDPLAGYRD
jgi:hypothetical protein